MTKQIEYIKMSNEYVWISRLDGRCRTFQNVPESTRSNIADTANHFAIHKRQGTIYARHDGWSYWLDAPRHAKR